MSDAAKRRELAQTIARRLADEGKLIEAGWQLYRLMAIPDVRVISELDRYKDVWDAASQHLFSCIFDIMESGEEETPNDMRRMDNIQAEVDAINRRMELRYGRPKDTA